MDNQDSNHSTLELAEVNQPGLEVVQPGLEVHRVYLSSKELDRELPETPIESDFPFYLQDVKHTYIEPSIADKEWRRRCGLKRRTFTIVTVAAAVLLVVAIIAGILGGVLGHRIHQQHLSGTVDDTLANTFPTNNTLTNPCTLGRAYCGWDLMKIGNYHDTITAELVNKGFPTDPNAIFNYLYNCSDSQGGVTVVQFCHGDYSCQDRGTALDDYC